MDWTGRPSGHGTDSQFPDPMQRRLGNMQWIYGTPIKTNKAIYGLIENRMWQLLGQTLETTIYDPTPQPLIPIVNGLVLVWGGLPG